MVLLLFARWWMPWTGPKVHTRFCSFMCKWAELDVNVDLFLHICNWTETGWKQLFSWMFCQRSGPQNVSICCTSATLTSWQSIWSFLLQMRSTKLRALHELYSPMFSRAVAAGTNLLMLLANVAINVHVCFSECRTPAFLSNSLSVAQPISGW